MSYARPQTLIDAITLLSRDGARVLAGGTDLYPSTQAQDLAGAIVDLTAIPGLTGITQGPDGLCIGAATPWSTIAEAPLPPALTALQQAALQVGGRQIQNAGTLGGNLCNASPAADGVPPLLALDASVELAGPTGTRRLALPDFLLGPRRTALAKAEVMTAILIPATVLTGRSAFLKLGARAHLVISIVMAAANIDSHAGRITAARLAIGSCGPVATRLAHLESALIGRPVQDAPTLVTEAALSTALAPIDDIRATAAYRLSAATELLRRAIAGCAA